jgi:hypothetical protein
VIDVIYSTALTNWKDVWDTMQATLDHLEEASVIDDSGNTVDLWCSENGLRFVLIGTGLPPPIDAVVTPLMGCLEEDEYLLFTTSASPRMTDKGTQMILVAREKIATVPAADAADELIRIFEDEVYLDDFPSKDTTEIRLDADA